MNVTAGDSRLGWPQPRPLLLALEQAGAYIQASGGSLASYLASWFDASQPRIATVFQTVK